MCSFFPPSPRLSAGSQQAVCRCFLHVFNPSSDDLLLTHGIGFTKLCEAAKDLTAAPPHFTENRGFDHTHNIIYMKINLRAISTQRNWVNIRKPIKLTAV